MSNQLCSQLAQPVTFHEVTQKVILELKTISFILFSHRLSNALFTSVTATIKLQGMVLAEFESNQLEEECTDINLHQSCMVKPHRGHQQHTALHLAVILCAALLPQRAAASKHDPSV